MTSKKLSVIVPAYNEEEHIGRCISSILSDDLPQDQLEVIVVDDGSRDRTVDIVKSYPVRLIPLGENRGAASARNVGIKAAVGEILLFMDADAALGKGSLLEHVRHHEKYDIVYGVYNQAGGAQLFAKYSQAYAAVCWKTQNINFNTTSYKRWIFDNLRFDENIKACGYEDTDMVERILAKNYRIIRSDRITVTHFPHEKSLWFVIKKTFRFGVNLPVYALRHPSAASFVKPLLIPLLLLSVVLSPTIGIFLTVVLLLILHPNVVDVMRMAKIGGWAYFLPFLLLNVVLKVAFFSGVSWGMLRVVGMRLLMLSKKPSIP